MVNRPPPKFNAQSFSVGRFHFYFLHDTRGSRPFCVCQGWAQSGPKGCRFDPLSGHFKYAKK